MKISHIIPVILLSLGIIGGVLYAAGINLPWGSPESSSSGYLSPTSGGTKDIALAGGGCVKVTSTTGTQYFIPTRTAGEIASFTGNLPSGLSVGSCITSCSWNMGGGPAYCGARGGVPLWQGEDFDTIVTPTCTLALSGTVKAVTEGEPCMGGSVYIYPVVCECGGSRIIHGLCGTANGGIFSSYPTSNHCSKGVKVNEDTAGSDGTYNWRCDGLGGGSNVSCSATKSGGGFGGSCNWVQSIAGGKLTNGPFCDDAKFDSCTSAQDGVLESCRDSTNSDKYNMICTCGGTMINGTCGSANGATTATYPTSNHCSVGTKLDIDTVATDGTYDWRCDGSGGGSNMNCTGYPMQCNISRTRHIGPNYDTEDVDELLVGETSATYPVLPPGNGIWFYSCSSNVPGIPCSNNIDNGYVSFTCGTPTVVSSASYGATSSLDWNSDSNRCCIQGTRNTGGRHWTERTCVSPQSQTKLSAEFPGTIADNEPVSVSLYSDGKCKREGYGIEQTN